MGFGKCWCGLDLVEVNYGGGNGQGKHHATLWQCPTHGSNYEKKPD